MAKKNTKKYLPDTSALITGAVSGLIEQDEIKGEIVILENVISELENQANKNKQIGFEGLDEINKLKEYDKKKKIKLTYHGKRPTTEDIKAARYGAIDAMIREAATKLGATLITGDYVLYMTAKARGIECIHLETEAKERLDIEKLFDDETMSVHLREGYFPLAKKGKPGEVKLVKISDKPVNEENITENIREIIDYGRKNQCTEINKRGATVVQKDNIRIAITEPPFSDKMEITAVRPIAKVDLNDYKISDKLMKRLKDRAEGIFICGPPGAGKSSFAAALAEYYMKEKNAIVKTMESPRDLQVGDEITQYGALEGSMAKTADILLLVRPDYTIYDEVRKTGDFKIFADMRLAGVGMVGVTHASKPIDAIQRMVGKLELGQITHIVDTIIFVKDAEIKKVYETKMSVKVPSGMMESDLARPVIEVADFETGTVEYEIYTFGEETVVMESGKGPEEVFGNAVEYKKDYVINFDNKLKGKEISIYAGKRFLTKTKLGRGCSLTIKRKSKLGKIIARAMRYNDAIRGLVE